MSDTPSIPQQQLLYMRDIIMRQTDYDEETTEQKLKEHNNDVLKIIREYMGSSNQRKETAKNSSVNQQTYKEIRKLMDNAASRYRIKKEIDERRENIIASVRAQQEQARNNRESEKK